MSLGFVQQPRHPIPNNAHLAITKSCDSPTLPSAEARARPVSTKCMSVSRCCVCWFVIACVFTGLFGWAYHMYRTCNTCDTPWDTSTQYPNQFECFDGTYCNFVVEGHGCCDCHKGRKRCNLDSPYMTTERSCGAFNDYCCSNVPPTFNRTCGMPLFEKYAPELGLQCPTPPRPPPSPSLPPFPPLQPSSAVSYHPNNLTFRLVDISYISIFKMMEPYGLNCKWAPYQREGKLRIITNESITVERCLLMCAADSACTGFELGGPTGGSADPGLAVMPQCIHYYEGGCSPCNPSFASWSPSYLNQPPSMSYVTFYRRSFVQQCV